MSEQVPSKDVTTCATHAAEHRQRDELPCPWCVIDELKRNRDSLEADLKKFVAHAIGPRAPSESPSPIVTDRVSHDQLRTLIQFAEKWQLHAILPALIELRDRRAAPEPRSVDPEAAYEAWREANQATTPVPNRYDAFKAGFQAGSTAQPPSPDDARDAQRYRFLRQPDHAIVYARDPNAWGHNTPGHIRYNTPEQLDAAIDAACSGTTKGAGHG